MPSWVSDGLNSGSGLRFGVALMLAGVLHGALLLGIEGWWGDAGVRTSVIDIILAVDAAPRGPAPATASAPAPVRNLRESGADSGPARGIGGGAPDLSGTRRDAPDLAGMRAAAEVPEPLPPQEASGGQGAHWAATRGSVPAGVREPGRPKPVADESPLGDRAPTPGSPAQSVTELSGLTGAELARAIANAHAEREREATMRAGKRRTKRLTSAAAKTAAEAAYLDMWRQKIERIGRANYPPGGYSGELLLLAVIRHDGALREARVLETSGRAELDAAAVRIVHLAAPYSPFPVELRKSYDQLEIERRWRFARGNTLP